MLMVSQRYFSIMAEILSARLGIGSMPRTQGSSVAANGCACAVGVGDKPIIHFANAKHFLDHLAGIALAQLYLFGKKFCVANFYGIELRHKNGLYTAKIYKPLYAVKDECFLFARNNSI